jgi:hypothetical protein
MESEVKCKPRPYQVVEGNVLPRLCTSNFEAHLFGSALLRRSCDVGTRTQIVDCIKLTDLSQCAIFPNFHIPVN